MGRRIGSTGLGRTFFHGMPRSGARALRKVDGRPIPIHNTTMASISRRLLLYSRRCPSRIPSRSNIPTLTAQWQRPLSTTSPVYAKEPTKEGSATAAAAESPSKVADESATSSSPETETARQLRKLVEDLKALDPDVVQDAIRKGKHGIPFAKDFELENDEDLEIAEETGRAGFWAEGEESLGPDEDYYGDDLTSLGHGELEQHRELREYARLIAWELPLLSRTSILPPPAMSYRFATSINPHGHET